MLHSCAFHNSLALTKETHWNGATFQITSRCGIWTRDIHVRKSLTATVTYYCFGEAPVQHSYKLYFVIVIHSSCSNSVFPLLARYDPVQGLMSSILSQQLTCVTSFTYVTHMQSLLLLYATHVGKCGPGSSSVKALDYWLDGPGSIPSVGGVGIFLHSFVTWLVLGSTQPPVKVLGDFPGGKGNRAYD